MRCAFAALALVAAPAAAAQRADTPAPPADFYADRDYPAVDMARARDEMMREEGGQIFTRTLFNLAEYQARAGRDGYRWDGEAWIGGDIDRAAIRTEGEGERGGQVEAAEVQALWSHAIGPYFNAQGGIRQDVGGPARLSDRQYVECPLRRR